MEFSYAPGDFQDSENQLVHIQMSTFLRHDHLDVRRGSDGHGLSQCWKIRGAGDNDSRHLMLQWIQFVKLVHVLAFPRWPYIQKLHQHCNAVFLLCPFSESEWNRGREQWLSSPRSPPFNDWSFTHLKSFHGNIGCRRC